MDAFLQALRGVDPAPGSSAIEVAIAGAARARSMGTAFLAGYQAALRTLVPSLEPGQVVALCATEEGGAHPRAIATRLEREGPGWVLTGKKRWVTGGTRAEALLIVASVGQDAGRNKLRVALVPASAPGVKVIELPATSFVPDVPHAAVELERVRVSEQDLLEGDGYDRYLKPFRTIEDVHVHGAAVAHLLALGWRAGWPRPLREEGLALLAAARSLAASPPSEPGTHLALAGTITLGRAWLERTREHWPSLEEGTRAALVRDWPILEVAAKVRAQRTEKAWSSHPLS